VCVLYHVKDSRLPIPNLLISLPSILISLMPMPLDTYEGWLVVRIEANERMAPTTSSSLDHEHQRRNSYTKMRELRRKKPFALASPINYLLGVSPFVRFQLKESYAYESSRPRGLLYVETSRGMYHDHGHSLELPKLIQLYA
jgi:hypothetical protein